MRKEGLFVGYRGKPEAGKLKAEISRIRNQILELEEMLLGLNSRRSPTAIRKLESLPNRLDSRLCKRKVEDRKTS